MKTIHLTDQFKRVLLRERSRADRYGLFFSVLDFSTSGSNHMSTRPIEKLLEGRLRLSDEIGRLHKSRIAALLSNASKKDAERLSTSILNKLSNNSVNVACTIYSYPDKTDDDNDADKNKEDINDIQRNITYKPLTHILESIDVSDGSKRYKKSRAQSLTASIFSRSPIANNFSKGFIICNNKIPLWKRFIDILGSSFGLILLSPIFLFLSIMIKIGSSGPVFFRQERCGLHGKNFNLIKFRTMYHDVRHSVHQKYIVDLISSEIKNPFNNQPMKKLDDRDPQIIPFGRLLRKLYLDELPQFVNVLKGDMSLVGPRPPIPYEVHAYQLWHMRRLDVLPGMTGLWQVNGKNRLSFNEMVRLDIKYANNLSIFNDLKILIKTPIFIFTDFFLPSISNKYIWKGAKGNV